MALTSLLAEVLFVGHSLVGPMLPGMVETGLAAMETPVPVRAHVINGAPLKWNWEHSAEAEGVDGRAEIGRGQVTDLILTEAQPIADQLKWAETADFLAQWADAAEAGHPGARVWLYETWPPLGGGPSAEAEWRAAVRADLPLWQEAAGDRARIIPAGQAMAALSEAIEAGHVVGLTSIRQLFTDEVHLNGKGNYMVAMVQLSALTGRSPRGLTERLFRIWPDRAAVVTRAQADAFQRIAWQTVQDFNAAEAPPPAQDDTSEVKVAAPPVSELPVPETEAPEGEAVPPVPDGAGVLAGPDPSPAPTEGTGLPDGDSSATEADKLEAALTAALDPEPVAGPEPAPKATSQPQGKDPIAGAPPQFQPILNPNLAFGLAGVSDWSVQQPFLDLMKTARPWIGHLPGRWGGWGEAELRQAGALDDEGWPRSIPEGLTGIATLILTDLPEDAGGVAGRYLLTYEGKGELRLEGLARDLDLRPGEIRFSYAPGPGSVVMTLLDTDPSDPLRRIRVVREDRAPLLAEGEIFNPDWLDRLAGIRMFRAMDWLATNNSTLASAASRPRPDDYSWARQGVPVEVVMALANELRAEPWINLPHLADDQLVREIAAVAGRDLDPELRLWAEYSNEVWNWQFAQAQWAEDQAQARWGQQHGWVQFYALRAAEVMAIMADEMPKARLVRVISTQTGWMGLEEQILAAPHVLAEGGAAPAGSFDAYAVTGYFAGGLGAAEKLPLVRSWLDESAGAARAAAVAAGLTGDEADAYQAAHRFDLADRRAAAELRDGSVSGNGEDSLLWLTGTVLPYHAAVAKKAGLALVMYEGGSHVVANGAGVDDPALTEFFIHLNYTPEMGALYGDLLASWNRLSEAPFNAFVDVERPGKWGSWGALRHLWDDNPRWQALAGDCASC